MIKELGWDSLEHRRLVNELGIFYKIYKGRVGISLPAEISRNTIKLDCSQSPIFPWDFRDSNASFELPPSCKNERNLGRVSKQPRGAKSGYIEEHEK